VTIKMSANSNQVTNFWASSAESDVRSSGANNDTNQSGVYNPYTPSYERNGGRGYGSGRGGNRGGRGGDQWRPNRIENPHPIQEPEPFQQETKELLIKMVKTEPKTTFSTIDFGDIRDVRENFRAVLYLAVEKGISEYKSTNRLELAARWQFSSADKLLYLINHPDKMSSEVHKLNLSHGNLSPQNERTRLYDFPDVLLEMTSCVD
jgi:hypothetical protein